MQRAAYVAEFQFGYNNRQNPNIFDGDCGMLTWRAWALWLLAFALLLLVVGTSSSFQECMRSYPYQPSGQGFQEQGSAFLIVLGGVPVCLRDFLGDNIEALATLFIAIFTWTLWRATTQLSATTLLIGANQSRETRLLQRAYIAVEPRGIMPFRKDDHTVGNIGIVNVGRMPASHLRLFVDMKVNGNGRLDDFPINEERLFGNNILPPGTTMLHSMNFIFSGFEYDHVRSGGAYLYVWGIVRYLDGFGQERFTRFCHRYTGTGYFHFREGIHAGKEALLAESGRYHEYGNDAD